MKKIKLRPVTVILLALTLLWCAVIFAFSSRSADESTADSDGVTKLIATFVDELFGVEVNFSSFVIRKAAHMTEFAVLGVLASLTLASAVGWLNKRCLLFCLAFCVFIASLDELSQFLSPGRSPQVRDVLIDACGAAGGIFIVKLANRIYLKNQLQERG